MLTLAQHCPPTAGTGVGSAPTVGVDDDNIFGHAPRIGGDIMAYRTDIPNS
jgi:hypothetical protein